ncbi:HprK-related kinase A [Thalassotalea euphylliae]|uniref:HprK-related kinase A n=1 Tax=Thalassotalea euphylliae TaxID=1655234 RepID=UPI0015F2953E|nr:HprK-related kinase A [Thalassotalea euphylliae]
MKLKDLTLSNAHQRSTHDGLKLAIGPFNFSITTNFKDVTKNLYRLYGHFDIAPVDQIIDFEIAIKKPNNIRRCFKPQAFFYLDGKSPFLPLPAAQAFPLLEWGMNWCIAQHDQEQLTIHAGVLERDGVAVILPAASGSGKSTLTAILVQQGWRLLSDEMTLVDLENLAITPIARPISLKNHSIELIKSLDESALFSDIVKDTNKGTIAHLKPNDTAVDSINHKVTPTAIIFPKYEYQAQVSMTKIEKGQAFMRTIDQCFNYSLLGEEGFKCMEQLIKTCDCYEFVYSSTADAIAAFDTIAKQADGYAK